MRAVPLVLGWTRFLVCCSCYGRCNGLRQVTTVCKREKCRCNGLRKENREVTIVRKCKQYWFCSDRMDFKYAAGAAVYVIGSAVVNANIIVSVGWSRLLVRCRCYCLCNWLCKSTISCTCKRHCSVSDEIDFWYAADATVYVMCYESSLSFVDANGTVFIRIASISATMQVLRSM